MKVLFVEKSDNRKIGNAAASYTEKSSCPDTCDLKNNGCYADGYPTNYAWSSLNNFGSRNSHYDWEEFVFRVRSLHKGKVFRHNVAGDLPGENNEIDFTKLKSLVDACKKIKGFTFTHKPVGFGSFGSKDDEVRAKNASAIKYANSNGFAVNLSADDIHQADYLKSLNIGPVVCIVPEEYPDRSISPEGNHVIVCLNEKDSSMTCDRCMLCTIPNRKSIIAFRAHGVKKKKISERIRGRVHLNVANGQA